jgi:hypothetical protein
MRNASPVISMALAMPFLNWGCGAGPNTWDAQGQQPSTHEGLQQPTGQASMSEPLCREATFFGFGLAYRNEQCDSDRCLRRQSLEVTQGGRVFSEQNGYRRDCIVREAELAAFARIALQPTVIAALRISPIACAVAPGVPSEWMQMEIDRGLFVRTETGGCTSGPVSELRAAAWNLADFCSNDSGISSPSDAAIDSR